MPKLVIDDGDGTTREVTLSDGDTLGRVSKNAVQIKVAEASRTHCKFTLEKNSWFIEDLGSSNGTLVNGRKVSKFEMADGDMIQIGKVTLRFLDAPLEEEAEPEVEWGDDDISLEDEYFLVLGLAGREGDVVHLPEGATTVGRNARHGLVIKDASVSGNHASIQRSGSQVTVEDTGSSNGTFVNDRRIEKGELQSGDVVRFGGIPCTFGVGDPADFEAPVAVDDEQDESYTRMMESEGLEDPHFELSGAAPAKDGVWNLVALVLVLALGAGAFFVFTWKSGAGGAGGSLDRGSNMLPALAWSFESPDVPDEEDESASDDLLWDKLDSGAPGDVEEVGEPVRSGSLALLVEHRAAEIKPTLASLAHQVSVTPGQAYRLSAHVTRERGSPVPVLAAIWNRREVDDTPIEITRDFVFGKTPSNEDWDEMGGVVVAPEGANMLTFCVGVSGKGSVVFDDAVLATATPFPGQVAAPGEGFQAVLRSQGTLRFFRFGRGIVDGLGLVFRDGDAVQSQDALLIGERVGDPAGTVSGSLRGGLGDVLVRSTNRDDGFSVSWQGQGVAKASHLRFPLLERDGSFEVSLLDGETGSRRVQPFADEPATSLIVGSQDDRAMVHLRDEAGKPLRLKATLEVIERRPVLSVALDGRESVTLDVQISFAAEEKSARSLLSDADTARRGERTGEAIVLCERLMARYPFEQKLVESASSMRARLVGEGRDRLEKLRGRVDDAIFFRTLHREPELATAIATEEKRFSGTSLEGEFKRQRDRFGKAVDGWSAPRRDLVAERLFKRAQDYAKGEKSELALLFFDSVVQDFDGTDWADQARVLKGRVKKSGEKD